MPRRLLLAPLCVLALLGPARADIETQVVATEHYRLEAEAGPEEAAELGRLLEAAWPQLRDHFGAAPRLPRDETLRIRFLATQERWAAALREAGVTPPTDAGGYYDPRTRTAFLYRQGTRYFTRVLLLHEATHQFHYLARTNNDRPTGGWYREGVAEFMSWHLWDGETLRMAVRPPISLKDHAATALKAIGAPGFDLEAVVEDRSWPGYPVAWALYRYVATGRGGRPLPGFDALRRKLDGGAGAGGSFRKISRKLDQFGASFEAWLRESQQPWVSVYAQWDPRGDDAFVGVASVVSVCRLKTPTRRLEARLEAPAASGGRAGLLLHYSDGEDYTVALVKGDRLHVDRRAGKRWRRLARLPLAAAPEDGSRRLEARREADGVHLRIGDEEFGPWELPAAPMGLAIDDCERVFGDVRWEPVAEPVGPSDRDS